MIKKRLNLRKQKIFFYSIHIAAPKKKVKKWSLFGLKNIYYKKIIESIDNCFNNLNEYQNICEIIAWIRTLLKDFNEESLELIIVSDDYNLNIK